jgi:hypothetical protein
MIAVRVVPSAVLDHGLDPWLAGLAGRSQASKNAEIMEACKVTAGDVLDVIASVRVRTSASPSAARSSRRLMPLTLNARRPSGGPYDAAYVALAEALAADLVTVDSKVSKVPGIRCRVRNLRNGH